MARRDIALLLLLVVAMFANVISTSTATTYKKARSLVVETRSIFQEEVSKMQTLVSSNNLETAKIMKRLVSSLSVSKNSPAALSCVQNLSDHGQDSDSPKVKFDYFEVGDNRYANIDGQYYRAGELSPLGKIEKVLKSGLLIGGIFYARVN